MHLFRIISTFVAVAFIAGCAAISETPTVPSYTKATDARIRVYSEPLIASNILIFPDHACTGSDTFSSYKYPNFNAMKRPVWMVGLPKNNKTVGMPMPINPPLDIFGDNMPQNKPMMLFNEYILKGGQTIMVEYGASQQNTGRITLPGSGPFFFNLALKAGKDYEIMPDRFGNIIALEMQYKQTVFEDIPTNDLNFNHCVQH